MWLTLLATSLAIAAELNDARMAKLLKPSYDNTMNIIATISVYI